MLLSPNAALCAIDVADDLAVVGDVRGGYYGSQQTDQDGSEDSTDQLLGRIRAGLEWTPTRRDGHARRRRKGAPG